VDVLAAEGYPLLAQVTQAEHFHLVASTIKWSLRGISSNRRRLSADIAVSKL
jgi:hypothetical protein